MRKINLLLLFLVISGSSYSQAVYFFTGKNYTTYDLKNEGLSVNPFTKKGVGTSYEIGVSFPIMMERLPFDNPMDYSVGLTINQYNAKAGNAVNSYEWETEYVGLQNSLGYSFVKTNSLDLSVKGGVNFGTLLFGNQKINDSTYDLKNYKEFTGVILTPSLGFQAKCNLSEYGYLSLGYNYSQSVGLTNSTPKKLSFKTHQILFGIFFELY